MTWNSLKNKIRKFLYFDINRIANLNRIANVFVYLCVVPLIIVTILLTVLMIYKIVTGNDLIQLLLFSSLAKQTPVAAQNTTDLLTQTQNFLSFLSVFFTVLIAISGILGWYLKKRLEKLEQIEKNFESLNSLLLVGLEVAVLALPKSDESQHIPHQVAEIAGEIEKIYEKYPHILEVLDKSGNGTKLRLVRALYFYATKDYLRSIDILKEINDGQIGDIDVRKQAMYRLGIAYRHLDEFKKSVDIFRQLEKLC